MTLNDYKRICFREWLLRGELPALHLSEYALWELYYEEGNTPLHQVHQFNTAEWDDLWNERLLNPGLHSYVNTPNSHIAVFFRHYAQELVK